MTHIAGKLAHSSQRLKRIATRSVCQQSWSQWLLLCRTHHFLPFWWHSHR